MFVYPSEGDRFFDETLSELRLLADKGDLQENQYPFIRYMLSKEQLSSADVRMAAITFLQDAMNAVSGHSFVQRSANIMYMMPLLTWINCAAHDKRVISGTL